MKPLISAPLRFASALAGCGLLFGSASLAQSSATISGRVMNATGQPIANAVIRLVSDPAATPHVHPQRYVLIGDSLGKFSQEGIAPGAYLVMLFTDGKSENILESVSLKAGDAPVLEFSLGSRPQVQVLGRESTYSMVDRPRTSTQTR